VLVQQFSLQRGAAPSQRSNLRVRFGLMLVAVRLERVQVSA
jgi:hypothetical protein